MPRSQSANARIARHRPLEETRPPLQENIPNVIISSRIPANPCQFLKFFLYGAIQLAGALLATNLYCSPKKELVSMRKDLPNGAARPVREPGQLARRAPRKA